MIAVPASGQQLSNLSKCQNHSVDLLKHTPRFSDSVKSVRLCISNEVPGFPNAPGMVPTMWESLEIDSIIGLDIQ